MLHAAAAAAKSLQSCPTLCDPIEGSPPDSPVPGILQARTLEWVAISFSNAWKWKVKVKSLSRVRLLAAPWTAAYQTPLSMGFPRQEYWSGVPFPSPNLLWPNTKKPNLDWAACLSRNSSKADLQGFHPGVFILGTSFKYQFSQHRLLASFLFWFPLSSFSPTL